MFAKTIIDSDAFLDMPLSAQALYFHLSMRADDEGFVNNPKKIQRMVGASDDDCKLLVLKRFILTFESGVIVIKHWKIHNYIRNDRFKETVYVKEKSLLSLNENNAYTETDSVGIPDGRQVVYQMDTQVRLGKESIGKFSLDEDNIVEAEPPKPQRHKYGHYMNVLLSDEEYEKLQEEFPHDYTDRIERLSEYIASTGKKYKNYLATIRSWARKDSDKPSGPKGNSSNPFIDLLKEEGNL
jgi:hypothetical protein